MTLHRLRLYIDLIRITPATGWLLLLWPTLTGLWLAAKGFPGWHLLAVFVAGPILMHSAGCCINDVADRGFDRHVERTKDRHVTAGRISVAEALLVAGVILLAALALVLTTRWEAVVWAFPSLFLVILYPFTKRFFAMPQAVLGLSFGMGIPMAYCAVTGSTPWPLTAIMLVANLFWTLCYDTEYAMVDREDDLKIGMRTSAITLGSWEVRAIAVFYLIHISLWWTIFWQHANLSSPTTQSYAVGVWAITLLAALAQAAWHISLIRTRDRARCMKAFLHNHWIGCTGFIAACFLA